MTTRRPGGGRTRPPGGGRTRRPGGVGQGHTRCPGDHRADTEGQRTHPQPGVGLPAARRGVATALRASCGGGRGRGGLTHGTACPVVSKPPGKRPGRSLTVVDDDACGPAAAQRRQTGCRTYRFGLRPPHCPSLRHINGATPESGYPGPTAGNRNAAIRGFTGANRNTVTSMASRGARGWGLRASWCPLSGSGCCLPIAHHPRRISGATPECGYGRPLASKPSGSALVALSIETLRPRRESGQHNREPISNFPELLHRLFRGPVLLARPVWPEPTDREPDICFGRGGRLRRRPSRPRRVICTPKQLGRTEAS